MTCSKRTLNCAARYGISTRRSRVPILYVRLFSMSNTIARSKERASIVAGDYGHSPRWLRPSANTPKASHANASQSDTRARGTAVNLSGLSPTKSQIHEPA